MRVLAQRSLDSTDADEVLAAVRGMNVASTPESLAALAHLSQAHPDVRVRLAVITTLGELVRHVGDQDGRIHQIVREARNTQDTQVIEQVDMIAMQMDSPAGS